MLKFLNHITSKTKLLLSGILLILLPGAVISYMSLQSVSQKAENLRSKYNGTVRLVRDKLENELVQHEANLRRSVIESLPDSGKNQELKKWLDEIESDNPVFKHLFLVNAQNGIITSSVSSGWNRKPESFPEINARAINYFDQAEKEELIKRNYSAAVLTYQKALARTQSPAEYTLLLSRTGRCYYKSKNYKKGIAEYEKMLSQENGNTTLGNVPAWTIALTQQAEGYAALKNDSKKKDVLIDCYNRLLHHPWDLHDGSYLYYLKLVSNEINNSEIAYEDTSGINLAEPEQKEKKLLEKIEFVERIKQVILPSLNLQVNHTNNQIKSQPQHLRLTINDSGTETGFFQLPASFHRHGLSIFGYAFDDHFILSELFPESLNSVELGGDLFAGILNANDSLLYSRHNQAPDYLVASKFSGIFNQWKVALFDQNGKSIEQLVRKEKLLNLILFAGIIVVMLTGILFLLRAVAHEAEISRMKSEFVSNVSHELKTPLALIRMFGETLDAGIVTDEKKRKEFYGIIRKESERLTHLINNVLDFSRMDTGVKKYNFETTDLVKVVKNSLDAYLFHIRDNGFTTERVLPEEPVVVKIDKDAISQALLNLLSNAIKYSGDEKYMKVEVGKNQDSAFISVTDHGIGIQKNELKKIFEKFYRIPESQKSEKGGSGLGLTLTKQIIEAHNGTIEVESECNKGSTFTLRIPLPAEK